MAKKDNGKKTENTNPSENNQANKDLDISATSPEAVENKEEMCILCGEKPADKSHSKSSDLCEDCRKLFLRTPLRIGGFVAVIALIILSVSGLFVIRAHSNIIKTVVSSCESIKAGDHNTALSNFSDATTRSSMGWKTAAVFSDVCYDINMPDNIRALVSEFFYYETGEEKLSWQDKAGKSDLTAPWNKVLKERYDYIINFDEIANEKSKLFFKYYEQIKSGKDISEIPYDDIIRQYEAELAAATSNEEKGIICYYMLAIANACEKDVKTQLGYCKSIAGYLPDSSWLYIENLITLSIRAGEYENARKHIQTFSATSPDYAKRYTALTLRYEGKYDEAMKIFDELMADLENNQMLELFYDILICEFLAGDFESAYAYAADLIEYQQDFSPENINFYALLSKKLGYDDKYNQFVELLEQNGIELSPSVDKYLNGEITTEQLFKDGEVAFE